MPLKAVIDTLDGLNEGQVGLYVENDGKYFLDLDADSLKDHPGTKPLVVAYERVKESEKGKGATIATLQAKIAELEKGAPDTAATQAKIAALQDQLDAAKAEAGQWQGKYTGVTRDQSLSQALQTAGITNPTFQKAATAMLSGQVKLGDDGTAYVETGMGPKVLGDYVKAWAASEGKDFVSPPSGGGAKGGNGNAAGGKTIAASELEAMTPEAKAKFFKANPGVVVV